MNVKDDERHERVLYVAIERAQLESIVERAIAEKTGVPVEVLRLHGKLTIEANMEGSPSYQSGHRATFRATIPLSSSEDRT